jgi:hypothetical protein
MTRNHPIQDSEQRVLNKALDSDFDALVVSSGMYDGVDLQRAVDTKLLNQVIVEDGNIVYVCVARAGTQRSEAKWQCKKIDQSTTNTTLITWSDGNTKFDNVSSDPTTLTYS